MKAAAKHLAIADAQPPLGDFQTAQEEQDEIDAGYLWRLSLWTAMKKFAASYIGPDGQKGLAACAAQLDRRWGVQPYGRTVSESSLGAALKDSERNNFRLEWIDWFAARSGEIADLLARRVKPTKTDKEELEDLKNEIRETYPKHADGVIRKARTR